MLSLFSQIAFAQGTCTLNGQEVPCDEVTKQLAGFLGLGVGFMILAAVIGIACFIFWLMMLIHAASKPIENKAMWIILMVLTGIVGAIIYYFVVKRKFNAHSAPSQPARA